jgi:2-alkyl-3-oxoalkanoate reductase
MRVFVAGATGVLGQPTVKGLVAAGHEARGSARGEEKTALLRSLGATPVNTDLFDAASVREAVAGCDVVVHLATKIPSFMRMRWKGAWKENDRLRRDATRNLVDAALVAKATGLRAGVDHVPLRERRRQLARRRCAGRPSLEPA